jgi:hypothetical protein
MTIDHIFVRTHGGAAGSQALMEVKRHVVGSHLDPETGGLLTDHRPVIVDVRMLPQ